MQQPASGVELQLVELDAQKSSREQLTAFLRSFGHAGRGVREVLVSERNARVHVAAGALVFGVAIWLGVSAAGFAALSVAITLVCMAEVFNTAVETVVNLVSPNFHPLARRAKDVAAGAVLVAALGAVLTGLFVLGPPLLERLSGALH